MSSNATFSLADLVFYGIAAVTVGCAVYAVFSRNIVRAVFSLLGTFTGVAGIYALLSADFLAVVQILIYVGGVLVLMLFAVMLTSQIQTASISNPSGSRALGLLTGLGLLVLLVSLAFRAPWNNVTPGPYSETTASLGNALLDRGLFLFEVVALLLVAVVIGSVVLARRRPPEEPKP